MLLFWVPVIVVCGVLALGATLFVALIANNIYEQWGIQQAVIVFDRNQGPWRKEAEFELVRGSWFWCMLVYTHSARNYQMVRMEPLS